MANRIMLNQTSYHGAGAIAEIVTEAKAHAFQKAFVCSDPDLIKFGVTGKVTDLLDKEGLAYEIYSDIKANPTIDNVKNGVAAFKASGADYIIAIGGGSPIDAAKAMWVFYEYPELTFDDIKDPFSIPPLRQKAIFVAIPSTSGTASEVTAFSVITDYSTGIKYPLADFNLTPDIAVLDTDVPETMPPKLTAHTGMDALTHATEAYVSKFANGFTDPLAKQAISDIFDNLEASYSGDEEARSKMHIAQCLAGMAFSNALLGITHSLAHKIGAIFHIPHGCCNAILLPYVIQFNKKVCLARYADLARVAGLPGRTDEQLVISYEKAIQAMNKELGIANSFQEHGVTEELYLAHKDAIAHNAVLDACTPENPREVDDELMGRILECAYYGKKVTF